MAYYTDVKVKIAPGYWNPDRLDLSLTGTREARGRSTTEAMSLTITADDLEALVASARVASKARKEELAHTEERRRIMADIDKMPFSELKALREQNEILFS